MTVTSAKYNSDGTMIVATIDDMEWTVPVNASNRFYVTIQDWLKADPSNKVADYSTVVTSDDVNKERDRRMVLGSTFTVGSKSIYVTGRDEDARNLTNLALAAQLRIASGDATSLTVFRDGNNVDWSLTPPEVLSMWQQSATYVSVLYAKSWVIKAMSPIPSDYAANTYWS